VGVLALAIQSLHPLRAVRSGAPYGLSFCLAFYQLCAGLMSMQFSELSWV
jgi:hypothetical protein